VITRHCEGYIEKDEASPGRGRADAAMGEGQAEGLDRPRRIGGSDGSALAREPAFRQLRPAPAISRRLL